MPTPRERSARLDASVISPGRTTGRRLESSLRPLASGLRLRYPASGIRHQVSGIRYPASGILLPPPSSLPTSAWVGRRCVGAAPGRGRRRCRARRSLAPPKVAPAGTQPGPTESTAHPAAEREGVGLDGVSPHRRLPRPGRSPALPDCAISQRGPTDSAASRDLASGIWHLAPGLRHLASGIRYLVSGIRHRTRPYSAGKPAHSTRFAR